MSDMDEDYGFEYSDEDQDEEQVNVENQYYNAKGGRSLLFVIERSLFNEFFVFRREFRRFFVLTNLSFSPSFVCVRARDSLEQDCSKTRRTSRKRSRLLARSW